MKTLLIRLFGYPHEFLHVLALWCIGRRPLRITQIYVDIPDDLSTAEYVFVAGLPALVFWLGALGCVQMVLSAGSFLQFVLWGGLSLFFTLGGIGTIGDLLLIAARLLSPPPPPDV